MTKTETDSRTKLAKQQRRIAHEALTDAELESQVPPLWKPVSWWRLGLVFLALLVAIIALVRVL